MKDLHQLQVFLAVAENLSFTRAAESMLLTQSAVSHQVAALEKDLGAEVFSRSGRSVSLTPLGQVLAQQARRVLAVADEAEAAVRLAARPGTGRLRVGASSTACQHLIPQAVREFRECFPDYSLSITPGDAPVVAERLLDGSIDLGIMVRPEQKLRLTYVDLFEDELGFIVSPLHPWARRRRAEVRDLPTARLVLYDRNSATFRLVERYLLRMKAPLRDWIELGSMEAIKELVKLGLGVSVMARWNARAELEQRSLVWLPTPGGKLRRRWTIGHTPGRALSLAEQTFTSLCASVGAELARISHGG